MAAKRITEVEAIRFGDTWLVFRAAAGPLDAADRLEKLGSYDTAAEAEAAARATVRPGERLIVAGRVVLAVVR